jgi:Sec-independent protein translocase protein TatA
MFGVGLPEALFLLALLVMIFRPEQLAELARAVGGMAGRLRQVGQQFRDEVEKEWPVGATFPEPPPEPSDDAPKRGEPDA